MTESLRNLLRYATHDAHQRIDDALQLRGPDTSRSDYIAFLRSMWMIHRPYERALQGSQLYLKAIPSPMARMRTEKLRTDLEALGVSVSEPPPLTPEFTHLSEIFGIVYVFEGATLGGQVLSRHLRSALRLDAEHVRYLYGHGRETGALWRELITFFENTRLDAENRVRAVNTALGIFDRLEQALCNPLKEDARSSEWTLAQ
ncbi:MAG: biliverdin-producing heme oxygenase [Myxococcota bacterium]